VVYTLEIKLTVKNITDRAVSLQYAHLKSAITNETAELKVEIPGGLVPPSETTPIPPNVSVTLRAEFNPPIGLPAQEFIKVWGKMVLLVTYDGTAHEVQVSEQMTRSMYAAFRPNPFEPTVTRAMVQQGADVPSSASFASTSSVDLDLSAEKESLFELATKDPRAAIKNSWELLANDILWAANIAMRASEPDSAIMSQALARLESSTTYRFELVVELKTLQATARKVYYHSQWAYGPPESEAQEFILRCQDGRRQLAARRDIKGYDLG
jgi:hypothetical protein